MVSFNHLRRIKEFTRSVCLSVCLSICPLDYEGRSHHFWFGGLNPRSITYLLPFLLPFLPLLLLPSLSFSFSFRLLPFSSRILFPGVPSSYPKII